VHEGALGERTGLALIPRTHHSLSLSTNPRVSLIKP
jgi:hypothetical protein